MLPVLGIGRITESFAVLEADFVRPIVLDLLEALGLLEAIPAGVLGALVPLVVMAIGIEGRDWVQSTIRGLI